MTPQPIIKILGDNIEKVIIGKKQAVDYVLIALICRGHLLIEDVPGLGKTMLARALALMRASQARALLSGMDYVEPAMVKDLANVVLSHRIIPKPKARLAGKTADAILSEVLDDVPVPV